MLDGFRVPGSSVWHLGVFHLSPRYGATLCDREIWNVRHIAECDLPPNARICAGCRRELEKFLGGRYVIRERDK